MRKSIFLILLLALLFCFTGCALENQSISTSNTNTLKETEYFQNETNGKYGKKGKYLKTLEISNENYKFKVGGTYIIELKGCECIGCRGHEFNILIDARENENGKFEGVNEMTASILRENMPIVTNGYGEVCFRMYEEDPPFTIVIYEFVPTEHIEE